MGGSGDGNQLMPFSHEAHHFRYPAVIAFPVSSFSHFGWIVPPVYAPDTCYIIYMKSSAPEEGVYGMDK